MHKSIVALASLLALKEYVFRNNTHKVKKHTPTAYLYLGIGILNRQFGNWETDFTPSAHTFTETTEYILENHSDSTPFPIHILKEEVEKHRPDFSIKNSNYPKMGIWSN